MVNNKAGPFFLFSVCLMSIICALFIVLSVRTWEYITALLQSKICLKLIYFPLWEKRGGEVKDTFRLNMPVCFGHFGSQGQICIA